MLITASIVRQDGTVGEVDQAAFGFSHVIGIGPAAIGFFKGNTNAVGADYTIQSTDFEVMGDATAGDFTLQLPPATGSGLFLHLEKIDDTENVVTVAADGADLIQGSGSIALIEQWADCWLIDASSGFWDNPGASGSGGAGSLADLSDVAIDTPTDTQVLTYDAGTDKWINADSQGGGGGSTWGTITGTLSSQTDLQTALDAKVPATRTVNGHALSSNVTVSASDVGAPSGSGTSTGTNTGDQDLSVLVPKTTTVNGHALSSNVSVTAGDVGAPSGSGTCSGTNTGDQTSIVGITGTLSEFNTALTGADFATGGGTVSGTSSGTNTGDQTTVSGNAGTATALATARNIDGQSFNGTADITVIAPGTHAASSKATPVDADELPLVDSAASNVLAKLTWANLKATLKTYFDTLYVAISGALGTPSSGTLTNCTGLPIAGLTASTSTAIGVGSIELGAASDTTIARSGAGAVTVEGVQVLLSGAALGTPSSGTATNLTGTANGLTAGDVTRNHPVYAGASPPTVDVGPFVISVTGVAIGTGNGGTETTIFTVPTGRKFIATGAEVFVTAVTGGANGAPAFTIKDGSGGNVMLGQTAGATGIPQATLSNYVILRNASTLYRAAGPAANVTFVCVTANTSTTCTASVFLEGYYVA